MEKIAVAVLWHGMSLAEKSAACAKAVSEPILGQIQESTLYHLCRESFHSPNGHPNKEARIKASVLRERLPRALAILHGRADELPLRMDLQELVRICETKEKQTGEPCTLNMFFKLY